MNILVFCQYYYPEPFQLNEICEELVKNGNNVTIVTGLPNYPEGKIYREYENYKTNDELINGVRVIRCKIIPRGKSKIKLLFNYLSYMFLAKRKSLKLGKEYDIVFLYQLTPITQAYPAIKYCKKYNKKLICYCLDLAPASGEDIVGKHKLLMKFYDYFSKWAYKNCNHIAVTSKMFIDYLNLHHKIAINKISYLPQHSSSEYLKVDFKKNNHNFINIVFAGNIGYGARLDILIDAVKKIVDEGVKNFFVQIIGDGSDKQRLVNMVTNYQLSSYITFINRVSKIDLIDYYKNADALFVSLRKGQITVPLKLQSYMSIGKFIIGSMDGSGRNLIKDANCGICSQAENVDELSNNIKEYLNNKIEYDKKGQNGKEYFIKNFTLKKYINDLTKILNMKE